MNEFLKKMQQALVTGKKDDDVVDYIKTLDEKANKIENPTKAVEDRLKSANEKEKSSIEETEKPSMEEVEKMNKEMEELNKKEAEKLAMFAHIENMKSILKKIKSEFETLKEKYEKNIATISENIEKSEKEFNERYGELTFKDNFDIIKEDFEKNK